MIAGGGGITVTTDGPSVPRTVAVMVAVPGATPVTSPAEDTVATLGLLEAHATGADKTPSASNIAVSSVLTPIGTATVAGVTVTLRTPITESAAVADTGPEVAELVVVPLAMARTRPRSLIVATDGFVEIHATGLATTTHLAKNGRRKRK